MKIALINGSPKYKRSASERLLAGLRPGLAPADEVLECRFSSAVPAEQDLLRLCTCSVMIFAFPLYVDGIPGHLAACLERLEETLKIAPRRERMVYAVVNCGFYEGEQTAPALEMMAHWCRRAGLRWGRGLGVGAGGMLPEIDTVSMGHGVKKDIGRALLALVHDAEVGRGGPDRFVTANFPRPAYKATAELGWRQAVKRNGLKSKDLDMRR